MARKKIEDTRQLDIVINEHFFGRPMSSVPKKTKRFTHEQQSAYIPFYSSLLDDAWIIILNIRASSPQKQKAFFHNLKLRIYKRTNTFRWSELSYEDVMLWLTPLDICMAALDTIGFNKTEQGTSAA